MARINVCFNVSFLIFFKKVLYFKKLSLFFPKIIAINIVIAVNSWQAVTACILVAYTIGDIVLSFQ